MGAKVVEKVHAGVITSSPFSKLRAFNPNKIADEPLFTNKPYFFENKADTFSSNSTVLGPNPANHPSFKQSITAWISKSP